MKAILSALALLVLLAMLGRTSADADLWGHLTFGRDIVRAGAVHAAEPYSFTSDIPWINHEWLAEVLMWLAWRAGGAPGLVTLKLLLVCVAGALLLARWRPLGLGPAARDALLFATAISVWPLLITMRPQAFSVALFAVLLFVLERSRERGPAILLVLPPLFAVWVNVHGGWIVGAGALALFTACAPADPAWSMRSRAVLGSAAVASAAATLCNPYGPAMLGFLADTVRPERADIREWQPLTALPFAALALWLVPAGVAAGALWCSARRQPVTWRTPFGVPLASFAISVALAIGSLRVARLGGFFAIAVAFLLVPHAARLGTLRPVPVPPRRLRAMAAAAALLATAVGLMGRQIAVDGDWAPEPEAAAFARDHGLRGRMLTWFDYGEYAIWHLAPEVQVSMDGRRETVYSREMRDLHWRLYAGGPETLSELGRLDPDHVWIPRDLPLAATLVSAGWTPAFEGPRSVIFTREPLQVAPRRVAQSRPLGFPAP